MRYDVIMYFPPSFDEFSYFFLFLVKLEIKKETENLWKSVDNSK